MSHATDIWKIVDKTWLRREVISEKPYDIMLRKSAADITVFDFGVLMEKYREDQKELHCVFVDQKKVYDRMPTE